MNTASSTNQSSLLQVGFLAIIILVTGVGLVAGIGILSPPNSELKQNLVVPNGTATQITSKTNTTWGPDSFSLALNSIGKGTTSITPDQSTYDSGSNVQLYAIPDEGWVFIGWSGAISNVTNPITLKLTENTQITAIFEERKLSTIRYSLTTKIGGSGNGTITLDPPGGSYSSGTQVTLTARPAVGSKFSRWSSLAYVSNVTKITVVENETITAIFTQNMYNLTVLINPIDGGSVTRDHEGPYHLYENVTLTEIPHNEYIFTGWSGDKISSESLINVTILGDEVVSANFEEAPQGNSSPPPQSQPPIPILPVPLTYAINVITSGQGTVSKIPDQTTYSSGSRVQLLATPPTGWIFTGWSDDISGTSNPIALTVDKDKTITATFSQNSNTYTLRAIIAGTGSGSISLNPPGGSYQAGTVVTLMVTPTTGSTFSGWSGDLSGITNPVSLTINGNKAVTASFTSNTYTLTTNLTPTSGGIITRNNNGPYHLNDVVVLTESPNAGYTFSGWSGDGTGTGTTRTVTITGNMAVNAAYTQNTFSIAVNTSGQGSVVKNPNLSSYNYGSTIQITATSNVGWTFSGWSGDLSGTTNPATITVNRDEVITATFTQNSYTLTTTVSPSGCGIVTKSPNQATYHYGEVITFTEAPNPGYSFSAWSGSGSGTGTTRTVTVTGNVAVTATFTQNQYSLTVTVNPDSGGVVTKNNNGPYNLNDVVVLTESPNAGYTFSGWSGDGTGTGTTRTVTITGNMAVTATYSQNVYTLTLNTAGTGSGSVTLSPTGGSYTSGSVVTLTANPTGGSTFTSWGGDLSGSTNPSTITINGNKVVTATFTQNGYTLTVNVVGTGCSVTKNPSQTGYPSGAKVQLIPVAAAGWTFSRWSGALYGSSNPATVTMNGNKVVTATFTQNRYTLTISTSGSGSTSPSTGSRTYLSATKVQVTATPMSGWYLSHWTLDGVDSGSTNPITVTMNSGHTLKAVFTQSTNTLIVSVTGSGSTNPVEGSYVYSLGNSVPVTAIPADGWSLDHWVLDGSPVGSTNPYIVSMNTGHTLGVIFKQDQYTLSETVSGQGSISLTPDQPSYTYGTVIQMTAISATDWTFTGWSGDISGTSNPLSITVNGNMVLTATFTVNGYTLTVATNPIDSGIVIKSPDQASYSRGSVVQLTATPPIGWRFSGWSGDVISSSNPVTISMDSPKSVIASFIQNNYAILASAGLGGSISPSGNIIITQGSSQVFTITQNTGYQFSETLVDGYSVGTVSSYTFSNVQAPHMISASFAPIALSATPTYTIAIEGTNYVVRDSLGTSVSSNVNFATTWSSLNSKLVSGDTVTINNGVYIISTTLSLTKTHITISGSGSTTFKAATGFTNELLFIGGSYNVVKNMIFDDNNIGGVSAAVYLMGSYNSLTGSTLNNCNRYGFTTAQADHFTISNNTITKAQYGISGSDNGVNSVWSTNGIISNNHIAGCRDCGIKMKMWNTMLIENNQIDINSGASQVGDGQPSGIRFYLADSPVINTVVRNNIITTTGLSSYSVSGKNYHTVGILIDQDLRLDTPNITITISGNSNTQNIISNTYYGIRQQWIGTMDLTGNQFSGITVQNILIG